MNDTDALVDQAARGDRSAFTALVRRYGDMALGCALAILGDYQAAEDAAQEAFVSAYFGLATLRDPASFPGWLRGIVRNQSLRLVRTRRVPLVSLDAAFAVPDRAAGPSEQAESVERRDQVMDAIMVLPEGQREAVLLYYLGDYSQREIATFLGLPLTTVNNRLHAARQHLKGGLLTMVKDDLPSHSLPREFAELLGTIVDVHGPVVDAQFAPDRTPQPLDTVSLNHRAALTVIQREAEGRVRCITLTDTASVVTGMDVSSRGEVVQAALTPELLHQAVRVLVRPGPAPAAVAETGIKVLDLLCPLPGGGAFGLYGPHWAGKLVMLGEILHRLATETEVLFLNFVQTDTPAAMRPDEELPSASGAAQAVYLPVDDAADPASVSVQAVLGALHGAVFMSREMALAGLYPACDPLVSWSSLLREDVVGGDHVAVATDVRAVLHRCPLDGADAGADPALRATADRLRAYLTQPFYLAEPYTKIPGATVPLARTLVDCRAILDGRYDDVSLDDLRFIGELPPRA
jgi:RNA polymerase sigma factor (sigma-70 family)